MKYAKSIEEYLDNVGEWKEEVKLLREIMLSTPMEETLKWGIPVYTVNNKNVAGIGAFKSYAGFWFYQGVFLKDPKNKLINAQEGKTKALRQWRFESLSVIKKQHKTILAYVEEAIANQLAGLEMKPAKKKPLVIPRELKALLNTNKELQSCF